MIIPEIIELDDWCSSLVIDFPTDDVPILINGDWKSFGNTLSQTGNFAINNTPSPDNFNDWRSWAFSVFYLMNNNS